MKESELFQIEDFLQNTNIIRTIEHFFSLYKLIASRYPQFNLPQINPDTQK